MIPVTMGVEPDFTTVTSSRPSHHAGSSTFNGPEHACEDDIKSLRQRFDALKYADVMKTVLVEEVIAKYERTKQELNDFKAIHDNDLGLMQTVHHFQKLAKDRSQEVQHLQSLLNREPFVLILIDSKEVFFFHEFILMGEAGGRRAAEILHDATWKWANANVLEFPATSRIACRVYGSIELQLELYHRAGVACTKAQLERFWSGFNDSKPLFDFVNTGSIHQCSKIKETFHLHLFDFHCRQIFFGCNHDNSFAELLQCHENNPEVVDRVTILGGVPRSESNSLPFRVFDLPELLNVRSLDKRLQSNPSIFAQLQSDARSGYSEIDGISCEAIRSPEAHSTQISPFPTSPALEQKFLASISPYPPTAHKSWAVAAAKNAREPLKDLTHTRRSTDVTRPVNAHIQRNRKGQRLDDNIPYDRDEVQRIKKLKSCNQHYIGVGCCHYNAGREDKCPHHHQYVFTHAELQALRVIARETPCKRGHGCSDPNCIYGHRCPFPVAVNETSPGGAALCASGSNCRFPASMHGMDREPVRFTQIT